MADDIRLVIPDTGPFISLATADRLDLLERFTVPLATMDIVKAECLYKAWPGRERLEQWLKRNANRLEIIESPFMDAYAKAMEQERSKLKPEATRGLGDAAIAWYVINAPYIRPEHTTMLVLTEDATFGDKVLGRDVHALSTRAFLQTLENLKVIKSAKSVLADIERGGRVVAPYMADRPALVGPKKRSKTAWTSIIDKSDEHDRR